MSDAREALARAYQMARTGQPDMGGPRPHDYSAADRGIDALKTYGLAIVAIADIEELAERAENISEYELAEIIRNVIQAEGGGAPAEE